MPTPQRLQRSAALAIAATLIASGADARTVVGQQRGEMLYEAHCIACHTAQFHWRAQRLVSNWPSLLYQVRRWQSIASLAWTERDIAEVARHLNQRYYHLDETAPQMALKPVLHAGTGPRREEPTARDKRAERPTCASFDARQKAIDVAYLAWISHPFQP